MKSSTAHMFVVMLSSAVSFFLGIQYGAATQRWSHPSSRGTIGVVGNFDELPALPVNGNHNPSGKLTKRIMIAPGQVPHLTGFSGTLLSPGQTVPAHRHPTMHEVFYVVSGEGVFTIAGRRHAVRTGSFIHLAPGEEHSIETRRSPESESALRMVYFGIATDA